MRHARTCSVNRGCRPSPLLERVEELSVLLEREAVGHAGDVVGDHARQRLAVALRARGRAAAAACGSLM